MAQVEQHGRVRTAGVGAVVALWAFADGLVVGLPVLAATVATGRPLLAYVAGATVFLLLNLSACRWLDGEWDTWVAGSSFEGRLVQLRASPRAQRTVTAIEHGTTRGYGIAAALLSASQVVALHRIVTGEPTDQRQRTVVSIVPALLYPALYALVGWLAYSLA